MKRSKWFRSGASSLLMGAVFSILFGMSACKSPSNEDDNGGKTEKVKVVFKVDGANGTLTAKVKGETKGITTGADVEKGKTVVFTAKANDGYLIESLKSDNTAKAEAVGKKEFTLELKADKNLNVQVKFKQAEKPIEEVILNFTKEGHGKLTATVDGKSKNTGDKIAKGSTVTFTATPDPGYKVGAWTGLTATPADATTATLTANENVNVNVTFVQEEVTLNFTNGEHGNLTATVDGQSKNSGDKIAKGSTVTFTATPDPGYKVGAWTGLTATPADATTATLTANENVNVNVTFVAEKKDAMIAFVSINSTAWNSEKKIILDTPTGGDIQKENVAIKVKASDESGAEVVAEVSEIKPKTASDKLNLNEGETATLTITSKETEELKSAEIDVVVHVWKAMKAGDVTFKPTTVTPKDAINKVQTIVISSEYKADTFEVLSTKFIGSYMERTDEKKFPEGAKVSLKYELILKDGTVCPEQQSAEYVVPADKKRIYGCEIFPGSADGVTAENLKHQFLNEAHVGAKEKFTIEITLPETATEDFEVKNVCAVFNNANDKEPRTKIAETTFTVKGVVAELAQVGFESVETPAPDTTSAERNASFKVKYPKFALPTTEKYIDAILTLKNNEKFPKDAKIEVTYELTAANGTKYPEISSEYDVKENETKIFGHKLFDKFNQIAGYPKERTKLNANHIGATESYKFIITLPETATKDEYEITVVSALFDDKDTDEVEKELAKTTFKVRGYEIQKVENTITSACANDPSDSTNATKNITYTIKYPDFSWKEGQFIDSVIKMKDGSAFPQGTKITLQFDDNPAFEVYEVGTDVKKLFGSDLSKFGSHPGLNADLKNATQTFKLTIVLPNTATAENYTVETYTAVFAEPDNTNKEQPEVKKLGDSLDLVISGYGR